MKSIPIFELKILSYAILCRNWDILPKILSQTWSTNVLWKTKILLKLSISEENENQTHSHWTVSPSQLLKTKQNEWSKYNSEWSTNKKALKTQKSYARNLWSPLQTSFPPLSINKSIKETPRTMRFLKISDLHTKWSHDSNIFTSILGITFNASPLLQAAS